MKKWLLLTRNASKEGMNTSSLTGELNGFHSIIYVDDASHMIVKCNDT